MAEMSLDERLKELESYGEAAWGELGSWNVDWVAASRCYGGDWGTYGGMDRLGELCLLAGQGMFSQNEPARQLDFYTCRI